MNFKKLLSLTLTLLMLTSACASAKTLEFTLGSSLMYESSDVIKSEMLETAPYTKNDRTMVPVRIISESFGAQVEWNGELNTVTITKEDKTIILALGSAEAIVNGETVALDVAPEEFNGRTMVPLRFISETLGMDVGYVASTEQVIISDEEPVITVNDVAITIDDYKSYLTFAGFDPEVNSAAQFVPYTTDLLIQNFAAAHYMQNLGMTLPEQAYATVKETVGHYADAIYRNALTAPMAQLLENDALISNAVISSIDTEEGVQMAYEKYASEYVTAKHILISSETAGKEAAKKQAQQILNKLNKGEDFDTLMLEYNEDPGMEYYPDGYTFTTGEMVAEFETAAFALEEGQISELVESTYGYHIIKREPLAQADSSIINNLMNLIATELYNDVLYEATALSEITMHKTNEELIGIFE